MQRLRAQQVQPEPVRRRRALGQHLGRAGHGDGSRSGRRRALRVPLGRQQLPELQPGHHRQSQRGRPCRASAAPTPTTWARCWRGRATPRSAARRVRPTPRSMPRRSQRYREGRCAPSIRSGTTGGSIAAAVAAAGGGGASDERNELRSGQWRHRQHQQRPASAAGEEKPAIRRWRSSPTRRRNRACRPISSA